MENIRYTMNPWTLICLWQPVKVGVELGKPWFSLRSVSIKILTLQSFQIHFKMPVAFLSAHWSQWQIHTWSVIISHPCSNWFSIFHLSYTSCGTLKKSTNKYKMWRLSRLRLLTQQDFNVRYTADRLLLSVSSSESSFLSALLPVCRCAIMTLLVIYHWKLLIQIRLYSFCC